jgi:hypothetical protein
MTHTPDALAAALAWVDSEKRRDMRGHMCLEYACEQEFESADTLAAAVRELRGENLRLTHESNGRQFRLLQAEAALTEMRGRVCGTCRPFSQERPPYFSSTCLHCGMNVPERTIGNTCGAWAAKEPTP